MRKISGGSRSDGGARVHGIMTSVMETYRLQDKDFSDAEGGYLQNRLTFKR